MLASAPAITKLWVESEQVDELVGGWAISPTHRPIHPSIPKPKVDTPLAADCNLINVDTSHGHQR
jgi:hypothetical protein